MKILSIGGATQDIFIAYEDAASTHLHTAAEQSYLVFKEGSKIEVTDLVYSTGGGANNAAFSFKRQGFDIQPCFKVGRDNAGQFVLQRLHDADIPAGFVVQDAHEETGISFIMPSRKRDRVIFAYRGANASLHRDELPLEQIVDYDYLYITSLSGDASQLLLPITETARNHGVFVATNPGSSQLVAGASMLRDSLQNIDVLILNSSEAQQLMHSLSQDESTLHENIHHAPQTNTEDLPSLLRHSYNEHGAFHLNTFFQAVLSHGTDIVVVTNGAEGVYLATQDRVYFHPSVPVDIVNTIGAGDAFGSTFVGSLARKKTVEQALRYGIINAASVISYLDTQEGLLSIKELEEKERQLDPSLLQRFSLTNSL